MTADFNGNRSAFEIKTDEHDMFCDVDCFDDGPFRSFDADYPYGRCNCGKALTEDDIIICWDCRVWHNELEAEEYLARYYAEELAQAEARAEALFALWNDLDRLTIRELQRRRKPCANDETSDKKRGKAKCKSKARA